MRFVAHKGRDCASTHGRDAASRTPLRGLAASKQTADGPSRSLLLGQGGTAFTAVAEFVISSIRGSLALQSAGYSVIAAGRDPGTTAFIPEASGSRRSPWRHRSVAQVGAGRSQRHERHRQLGRGRRDSYRPRSGPPTATAGESLATNSIVSSPAWRATLSSPKRSHAASSRPSGRDREELADARRGQPRPPAAAVTRRLEDRSSQRDPMWAESGSAQPSRR